MSSNAILHLYINHKMNKLVGSNNITTYRQGRRSYFYEIDDVSYQAIIS